MPHQRGFFFLLGLFALFIPGVAVAQSADEVQAAQQRLVRLRAQPSEGVPPGALVSIAHYLEVAERYRGRGRERGNAERYYRIALQLLDEAFAPASLVEGQ